MKSDLQELLQRLLSQRSLQRAVMSGTLPETSGDDRADRIVLRPVLIRNQLMYQATLEFQREHRHQNLTEAEADAFVRERFPDVYRNLHLEEASGEHHVRRTKRGGLLASFSPHTSAKETPATVSLDHNRQRNYLIPDQQPCGFLIETGVMAADGVVRRKHFHKFRQINRYLEFIQDLVPLLPAEGRIHVVDFGCGKSYLTFATHFLLTQIHQRDCRIVGLDRRPDVVATCQRITDKLQLTGLEFSVGDIADYRPDTSVDLAISLHACDTATDAALASAVAWNCRVILAVPCCHHELAAAMPRQSVPSISRHGILHDRYAAMCTDAMRADLLSAAGYETSVMEFIDLEHTPKNLLIRAIRRENALAADGPRSNGLQRVESLRKFLSVGPMCMERLLMTAGKIPATAESLNSEPAS
ncbi:MAG: SAM-dependent methyltransferase [Planctomycetaceae bacterium]|nr:SAM-dependent methyltransferase [Planctomycetaceae bacterium]